jgi:hypothetical protein
MAIFSAWAFLAYLLLFSASLYLIFRNYLAPLFFERRTQLRVSSFSGVSLRGVEWRDSRSKSSIVPTLRVEKVGLAFGDWKCQEDGLIVLKVEGFSYRIAKKKDVAAAEEKQEEPKAKVSSALV